jgi:hypothetical protein
MFLAYMMDSTTTQDNLGQSVVELLRCHTILLIPTLLTAMSHRIYTTMLVRCFWCLRI